jgi:hypothetical protein
MASVLDSIENLTKAKEAAIAGAQVLSGLRSSSRISENKLAMSSAPANLNKKRIDKG